MLIETISEYEYCIGRGIEPLLDARFPMAIELRRQIQRSKFGIQADDKFFRWVWDHKKHYCEETMRPLNHYSAAFCSHILTRGAHPDMAVDPRNINILCLEMHNKWEFGNRKEMRIFAKNQVIINQLLKEYGTSRR